MKRKGATYACASSSISANQATLSVVTQVTRWALEVIPIEADHCNRFAAGARYVGRSKLP